MTPDELWNEIFLRRKIRQALRILALGDSDEHVDVVYVWMVAYKRSFGGRLPSLGWSIHNTRLALEQVK